MAQLRRLLNETDFAKASRAGAARGATVYSLSRDALASTSALDSRCFPSAYSTGGRKRDGNEIVQSGWKLDNFKSNPVLLWCHASDEPPIGKVLDINIRNGYLAGISQYADASQYPFADTIFRLVQGGYLNTFSVAWNPLKWSYSKDPNAPNSIIFQEQDLLEISMAPVPVDTGAIVTARAAGINTAPLAAWAERALDLRKPTPIGRAELEALYRDARPPTPRSAARMTSTLADREARLRKAAFDGIALGCDIPPQVLPRVWPPQSRAEHQAVTEGMLARAKQGRNG